MRSRTVIRPVTLATMHDERGHGEGAMLPLRDCDDCRHSDRLPEGSWCCVHDEPIPRPARLLRCHFFVWRRSGE